MMHSHAACYGKVRAHGDFFRHNGGTLWNAGLETWLDEGLQQAQGTLGPWDEVQRALLPMRMLWLDAKASSCLVGSVTPSRDKVGRRYPLMVALSMPASNDVGGLLYGYHQSLARLEDVGTMAARGLGTDALRGQLDALRPCFDSSAAERLESEAAGTSLRDFVAMVGAERHPAQWIANLATVMATERPEFVVTMTGDSDSLALALILRVVQRVGRGRCPRFVVWDERDRGSGPVKLRLLFDDVRSRYFVPIAFPETPSEVGWDITPVGGGGIAVDQVQDRTVHGLIREDARLVDLLAAI